MPRRRCEDERALERRFPAGVAGDDVPTVAVAGIEAGTKTLTTRPSEQASSQPSRNFFRGKHLASRLQREDGRLTEFGGSPGTPRMSWLNQAVATLVRVRNDLGRA
jgi:hypothetical protein